MLEALRVPVVPVEQAEQEVELRLMVVETPDAVKIPTALQGPTVTAPRVNSSENALRAAAMTANAAVVSSVISAAESVSILLVMETIAVLLEPTVTPTRSAVPAAVMI